MSDFKSLDHLGPIADEMLSGLHADDAMRLKIKQAAVNGSMVKRKRTAARFAPALCCAALAIACVGVIGTRTGAKESMSGSLNQGVMLAAEPAAARISTIAAGDASALEAGMMLADLGDGARVRRSAPAEESLFAEGSGDIPLIAVDGGVYRMLKTPKDIGSSLLGDSLGDVALFSEQPSLASAKEMKAGLSNVAGKGAVIYSVKGMKKSTIVAAEVDGNMRVFQRVSYAGKGPGSQSLEETFSVRGKVKEAALSGVGTLTGSKANEVIAVLLDHATLRSADASARRQSLTVTLENGLRLQLGVSGDTLCGCGGWSCPEFFEAFEAAL